MDLDLNLLDFRIIIEFCRDLSTSIIEKGRDELKYRYNGLMEIGQFSFLIEAMIRESKESNLTSETVHRLAATFGIFQCTTYLASLSNKIDDYPIEIDDDGNYILNIKI